MTEATAVKTLPEEILGRIPEELNARLKKYYCCNCGRFLAYQAVVEGTIVIKCHKCKEFNILDVRTVELDKPLEP